MRLELTLTRTHKPLCTMFMYYMAHGTKAVLHRHGGTEQQGVRFRVANSVHKYADPLRSPPSRLAVEVFGVRA